MHTNLLRKLHKFWTCISNFVTKLLSDIYTTNADILSKFGKKWPDGYCVTVNQL